MAAIISGRGSLLVKFFKSMKREYAEQFLARGTLRVGSLYDFRRVEDLGAEIGDEGEGTKELYTEQQRVDELTIPPFLSDRIRLGPDQSIIARDGFAARFEDPNLFVYCVSLDFDEERMRRLNHDACVVIEDGQMFFDSLQNAMRPYIAPGSGCVLDHVRYGPRRHHHTQDPNLPMAFVKPERFRYQNEARAVWVPRPGRLVEPFLIAAPFAILACRKSLLTI